jgi:septal ring factor EnvC (AmiA/AmiB activator)
VRVAPVALVLLLAPGLIGAQPGQQAKPDLEQLRKAIEGSRERVGRFEEEERAVLERLEEIDKSLSALVAALRRDRVQAERARRELALAEERSREASRRLATTRAAMRQRVVALYKTGEVGPVRLLFSSTSLREMLLRVSALRTVVGYDADLVARFRRERDAEEKAARDARAAAERRDAALRVLAERRTALDRERRTRRRVLARVHQDRTQERALLVELERAARALEETLAVLGEAPREDEAVDGGAFEAQRGRLAPPVEGEIAAPYGRVVDAQFQTEVFRKGVEFAARAGETVRAVADGVVRFAGWFRGYGKIVILDHGSGYFSVSGHLDEIFVEVGDEVRARDTIASVGETGSLAGPGLYFELRQGGQALDPAEWLRAGAGG